VSPEDANAKIRNEFAAVLLEMTEQLSPLFDAADGVRADMERRGWSPTAAETAALQFLMNSMQLIWAGVGKQ
jgi:hypothetical protein